MAEHRRAGRDERPDPEHHDDDRAQQLCLDAGRALVLCGVLVAIPPAFGPAGGAAAVSSMRSARALSGFFLWIVGACLCFLALTPVAPRAARVGAAAASIVLRRLSPLLS
ncbi:hypothetical protein HU200_043004 [Digitaria exilis]|uniref:Uncharacterized protein n=1 Tax=Digitaria exilis TaxID=1010633 RepID=A0A835EHU9_9POAL|nr:hypothetical protein HU200_043004 [Digitaria exilis]